MNKKKDKPKPPKEIIKKKKPEFSWREFKKRHSYVLLLILVGILLRFVTLGRQGLWIDEMCTWNDSQSTLRHIYGTMHSVVFILERLSRSIGWDHEYFLRLPSALGGLLGLIFIYPLALLLFNRRTALFAIILLVFSPINIYYSQDSNYYGLMMGLSTASIYFLFLFINRYNPLWLVLYAVFSYVNYNVHPSNILLVVSQLAALGLFLIFSADMHRHYHRLFDKIIRNKAAFGFAVAVALTVLLFVGYRFVRFIYYMSIESYGTVLAENLELTPRFFMKLAMDYALAFQQYTLYIFVLTLFFLLFFFGGLLAAWKKERYFTLFVLFSWTLPFIAIYIKKIGHFYHCRYTSFIVPGFLILAAYGLDRLGSLMEKRWEGRKVRVFLTAVFAIFALALIPNLFRYYTGEKQDWKGAVQYLRQHLKTGEKVTSHLFCNDSSLRFYYGYFHIDPTPIIKLSGEFRGSAYASLYRLKKLCLTEPGVYYATSYTRYEDAALWDWAKRYFEVAYFQPSLHPVEFNREGKEVILYKFKYTGSFVMPPYPFKTTVDELISPEKTFQRKILFDAESTYRMVFHVIDITDVADFRITAQSEDGRTISEVAQFGKAQDGDNLFALMKLSSGVWRVELSSGGKGARGRGRITGLTITPVVTGAYHREAEDTDLYHPTAWKRIETISNVRCFMLERDSYLYYDRIPFGQDGRFVFSLRAREDKPGPVLIEVAMDWHPKGFLIFDRGDDSWSVKTLLLDAPSGEHTVSLHYITPPGEIEKLVSGKMPADPAQDTDARLDYFEIRPLSSGEQVPDMRFAIEGRLVPRVPALEAGYKDVQSPAKLANGWQLDPALPFSFPADEPQHRDCIKITMPPGVPGLNMFSSIFPVRAGNFLYFSTWVKVERLDNHSANMRVVYLNRQNQAVGMHILNADGLTGATEWVRQVYFREVPRGAEQAVVLFWVYGNSRKFSEGTGNLYFDRIRFEGAKSK